MLHVTAACPASCVVCTQDVTLCHQLTYIVAAPETTRVLILTDGDLSSVEWTNLTLPVNLALLSLSRNAIYGIQKGSLHSRTKLWTLSLGHNHIPSSSLLDHTFSKLRSLQVLALTYNALRSLRRAWFQNSKVPSRLLQDGNQMTNLTQSSFKGATLHTLRHLDLSNNFSSFIEKDAFQQLPQLQEVDLSRNMLAHMPDAFTSLKQLSLLRLEGNHWSCTYDLHLPARILRNFVTSPAQTLHNTKNLNCEVFPPAVAAAENMLRLTETNCDSKGHNVTLALKDRRPLLPGQDVVLFTVLGFAGAIGLTCAGLIIFNWKLQQGRANGRTSENLCCRTLNESLCAHEARNGRAVGYCNCHLTRENETEVMSDVGSRKETPLRQENSHQAMLACESTALDASFRKLKGRDHGAHSACSCLGDELLQAACYGPPGNKKALYDADLVTRCSPKTAEKPNNQKHEEVQSQILPQHGKRTIDMSSGTFRSRYGTSVSTLAGVSLGKHLTNKSWQPPIGKGDNAAQRLFITSSSSKRREPGQRVGGRTAHRHSAGYDHHQDPLKQSKPTNSHPNISFTCKYVPWDAFQDFVRGKKADRREQAESEKQQAQINRAIEKFLRGQENKDKSRLSAKIKKACSTKRVKFQNPDLVRAKGLVVSAETPVSWKQGDSESQHLTSLDLKTCTSLEEVKEAREKLPEHRALKKKTLKPSHLREKAKGQNLRLKVDLHPFGKTRVHPEESTSDHNKRHKQTRLPLQRAARTFERKLKAKPVSFVSSQLPGRSSHAKLTCSKGPLQHALDQIPSQERNGTFTADSLSVDNQGSEQGSCCPMGHVPNGNLLMVPQPPVRVAEHHHSHPVLSPKQTENITGAQGEVLGPSPACLGNGENSVFRSQHSRGVIDHAVMVSTQHSDQDKLKINELNQFTLSLGYQVIDTFSKDHILDENQALQQEEPKSSHEQYGSEEKPYVNAFNLSHGRVENCIVDGKENDLGDKISPIKGRVSSPTAWTHSYNNSPCMVPHCLPHQHNCSGRGTDTNTLSQGDNGGEPAAAGMQAGVGEERQTLRERDANSHAASWTTQMGPAEERQQTLEVSRKEKLVLCYPSSDKETISIKDSSKVETSMLPSETDPQTHNHGSP
ncbi:leucine-rich repeat-containing protein 53 [Apodemus sylvaticus]|uniref:leucine-rich repeat-containing protein 53 n=1 Tax=Apodemus sylvaticus TaxID=10129 RepID=UPI0022447682|nr:leucine-rich repeat-containing protein 53 [Apodemus sylvaticus]